MERNRGSDPNNTPTIKCSTWIWFFVLICCVPLFFLSWFGDMIPTIRSSFFVSTQCVIKETLVSTFKGRIGSGIVDKPNVFLSFQVNGKEYNAWAYDLNSQLTSDPNLYESWRDMLRQGRTVTCWYDPLYPELVVLMKPNNTENIWFLGWPLMVILLIAVIFFYVRKIVGNK